MQNHLPAVADIKILVYLAMYSNPQSYLHTYNTHMKNISCKQLTYNTQALLPCSFIIHNFIWMCNVCVYLRR